MLQGRTPSWKAFFKSAEVAVVAAIGNRKADMVKATRIPLVEEDFPEAGRHKRGAVAERPASPRAKYEIAMTLPQRQLQDHSDAPFEYIFQSSP